MTIQSAFRAQVDAAARRLRGEDGQSLAEIAVVLPIMLTFVFGLMLLFMAFYTHEYISELAREGTRYAAVRGSSCTTSSGVSCTVTAAQVNSYVAGIGLPNLGGAPMTASNVATTYLDNDEAPGHRVQVKVTYSFPFNVPFLPRKTLSLSSTSLLYIAQ